MDHNQLWKILKDMRIPDHLTYLQRNYMQAKKQQLDVDVNKWFNTGKGVHQGCMLSACLFNFYAECIM